MSLRSACLVVLVLFLGCGGGETTSAKRPKGAKEPTTAKEKQLQEAQAAGEVDGPDAKFGKWRYTGDRNDCFFVVGQKCFKTEAAACTAAKCKPGVKCKSTGGGPATVACAAPKK